MVDLGEDDNLAAKAVACSLIGGCAHRHDLKCDITLETLTTRAVHNLLPQPVLSRHMPK
jgi:hypothetical protein